MRNSVHIIVMIFILISVTPCWPQVRSPSADTPEEDQRWSSFLSLMGEEAKKRGYELPLPFGASISFISIKRDIEVTDVEAGLNSDPSPVDIDLCNL